MRVVVCGRGATDTRSPIWAHAVCSMRALGHEVVAFDPTSPGRSGLVRGGPEESLRRLLMETSPHLFVHFPTPGDLDPTLVREATTSSQSVAVAVHMGATMVDAPTRITDIETHLRFYDLVTVPDPDTYRSLLPLGDYRIRLLEPATHVPVFDSAVDIERGGVVVVGEPDDHAADMVRIIVDAGVEVSLYGAAWSLQADLEARSYPRVPYTEMGTVLASAGLVLEINPPVTVQSNLGISAWEAGPAQCVLDAASVATPSVALARPGIDAFFRPGTDIFTFERTAELADLVPMLLADTETLARTGEAALDRIRSRHLWTDRWVEFLAPFNVPDDDGELVVVIDDRPAAPAAPAPTLSV